jgi:hypothetical protein
MYLIALHAPNYCWFKQSFLGETEGISIGGENGEIPYDPICLTSRAIRQPKPHLPLQDFEKVLLEHQ